MRTRYAFALLLAFPLVGCISLDVDFGGGWGGDSWGGGADGQTRVTREGDVSSRVVHLSRNDRIDLLLLIEGSGNGSVSTGYRPSGTIWTPSGRQVNWRCYPRFGKLPELRIDDVMFPFEGGRVFYIDVRDGRVLVQQIDIDPHQLASGKGSIRENVRANAAQNPIIAGFCERCGPTE